MIGLDSSDSLRLQAPTSGKSYRFTGRNGGAGMPPAAGGGGRPGDPDPFNEACEMVKVNLAAYKDGELDDDTFDLVDDHVSNCPRCSDILDSLNKLDQQIVREWQEYSPLPTSFEVQAAIDKILQQLPVMSDAQPVFSPRRVHARIRWNRFSAGLAGLIIFVFMLWSCYLLGYSHGKESGLSSYGTAQDVGFRLIMGTGSSALRPFANQQR